MKHALLYGCLVIVAACGAPSLTTQFENDGVRISEAKEVFVTVHSAEPRPYVGRSSRLAASRDRNHPMGTRSGEQHDHPHHQSLWFAHGNVNGFDFWHGKRHRERMVHEGTDIRYPRADVVEVDSRYSWQVDDGEVVLRERRLLRFTDHGAYRTIDAVTLRATEGEVTFGDTKEGSRAAPAPGPARRRQGRRGRADQQRRGRGQGCPGQARSLAARPGAGGRRAGRRRDLRPPRQPAAPDLVARAPTVWSRPTRLGCMILSASPRVPDRPLRLARS